MIVVGENFVRTLEFQITLSVKGEELCYSILMTGVRHVMRKMTKKKYVIYQCHDVLFFNVSEGILKKKE